MALYDVELTVSASGRVQIEAADLEDARKVAEQIQAWSVDVGLIGASGRDFLDQMSATTWPESFFLLLAMMRRPAIDVDIDGISEAEPKHDEEAS
jgi:hypothetical protein